jgi:hypothetical protein
VVKHVDAVELRLVAAAVLAAAADAVLVANHLQNLLQILAIARFSEVFSYWYFFWAVELQQKVALFWGGPASACSPENYHEKSESFAKISNKNGVTAQP